MAANPQPLSLLADVVVEVSPLAPSAPAFNQFLVIGTSGVIPTYGANALLRQYASLAAMETDGFTSSDPEYLAAQLYFSQSPAPQFIWIGVQDPTAIKTIIPHSGSAGTGYKVGDQITVVQSGASNGIVTVSTIGGGGAVTGLTTTIGNQGTGYSTASGLATTGGSGTGLEVDITAIGQTALQAAQACRLASTAWYDFMVCDATDSDHEAIIPWVEAQTGTYYFGVTQTASVRDGITPNVLSLVHGGNYKRSWIQYATTQGGQYPSQAYFVAAIAGVANAANTQLANSAFTMKFSAGRSLIGVYTEPLTLSQIDNVESLGGNLYINYAGSFEVLEQGTNVGGTFFDETLNLDVLGSGIQYAIVDLLTTVPKVPQTDAGQQLLIQAVEGALAQAALTGFIAQGIWQGASFGKIAPGLSLPSGYYVWSPSYATQSPADRQARKSMPIYVAIIEAGAVHSVLISVTVQR